MMASEKNKAYFNEAASSYDSKHEKTLDQIINEIRSRLDFIGVDWVDDNDDDESDTGGDEAANGGLGRNSSRKKHVRLLDYACGTGVVSRALAPYTTQCVGVDLSDGMVAAYNKRAENQGLAADEMRAYQGNLCSPDDPTPTSLADARFFNFDIAAVGLGFHHFDDPALAAKRLVERLQPGGTLLVLDFLPHGKLESSHPASHTVTRHGFSEAEIRKIFEDAGAGKDFALQDVAVIFNRDAEGNPSMRREVFLARGTKA